MVFPLLSILPLFLNVPVGLTVGALSLGAGAVGYFMGWPTLIGVLSKLRTWLIAAAIIGLVAFMHAGSTIQNQQQAAATDKAIIKTQKAVIKAQEDDVIVTSTLKHKMDHNEQVAKKILQVIEVAPDGSQQDAVWDTIIEEENSGGK